MRPKTRSARGRGRPTHREPAGSEKISETISETLAALEIGPNPGKSPKQRKVMAAQREVDGNVAGGSGTGGNIDGEGAKAEWSTQDEARLVELWQEEEHLYNKTNKEYRNAQLKIIALERIAADLNKDGK